MIGEPKCSFDAGEENQEKNNEDTFVYHKVPSEFKGDSIVPLSTLKDLDGRLYDKELEKYSGREELLSKHIDPLHCKWGDVVFLSPVHPRKIHQELIDAGFVGMPGSYFKIPLSNLENERLALIVSHHLRPAEKSILTFDPSLIDPHFSDAMRSYLREKKRADEQPFFHTHLQQVLYKGDIQTKDLDIIDIE